MVSLKNNNKRLELKKLYLPLRLEKIVLPTPNMFYEI